MDVVFDLLVLQRFLSPTDKVSLCPARELEDTPTV